MTKCINDNIQQSKTTWNYKNIYYNYLVEECKTIV